MTNYWFELLHHYLKEKGVILQSSIYLYSSILYANKAFNFNYMYYIYKFFFIKKIYDKIIKYSKILTNIFYILTYDPIFDFM